MTKGTMGLISCPILEDELVFGIEQDPEPKRVYVVESEFTRTLRKKLEQRSITYEMMDEYRVRTSMDLDPERFNIVIIMNPTRLHKEPEKLKEYIQDQLVMLEGRFDAIGLYYGMCGNYGWDPSVWAKDHISTPVTLFHDHDGEVCDDCIAVAVGGRKEYRQLVKDYTGMLFLTPAVATDWDAYPMYEDSKEWSGFYDSADDYMRDLFRWGNYEYALKIDTGLGDRPEVDGCCKEVTDRMGLKLIEPREPVATTALASDMYERTKGLLD